MFKRFASSLITPLAALLAATAGADPIHYDQIPSNTSGYFHWNMDGFLSSRIVAEFGDTTEIVKGMKSIFGGPIQSITIYTIGKTGDANIVAMLHAALSDDARERLESVVSKGANAVVIKYGDQDVHYSASSVQDLVSAAAAALTKNNAPPTTGDTNTEPPPQPKHVHFNIGLATGQSTDGLMNGHPYIAFVGDHLIVVASDLPTMAVALDVFSGKKTSLEKEDPQGLKANLPPGVITVGAGLTAELDADNTDKPGAATRPVRVNDHGPSNFGLDLFGSMKGKAVLARIDAGENEQFEFVDASFAMVDADSAEQLKNLVLGLKALVSMSQAAEKPFIDPLDVKSDGKNVVLHWSWPSAKLAELFPNKSANKHNATDSSNNKTDSALH